jgi:hypothetical protein
LTLLTLYTTPKYKEKPHIFLGKITLFPSVDLTLLCLSLEVSFDPAYTLQYTLHRIYKEKSHISFGKITLFPSVDLTLFCLSLEVSFDLLTLNSIHYTEFISFGKITLFSSVDLTLLCLSLEVSFDPAFRIH